MYLDYFSLERHPFRITPDTSLFFSGGSQGRGVVLDAMLYAIETGEGILKVVGEVGSGKTMLCRMLEERLPDSTEIVYIANPNLSPEDILYAIAFELKLMVRRDTSKLLVMQQLQNYLLKQHSANRRVLVIIEEAQGMPIETLEEVRLFSNLETQRDKLMQIILFGQPELDRNLSVKHIRQLRERITHSFYLNPLLNHEVADYIHFRLQAAGCPCPNLFSKPSQWLIAKASSGLTRRINILADKAMLSAFAEDVLADGEKLSPELSPKVTWRHVYAAIRDSEYSSSVLRSMFSPLHIMSASMVIVMIALTFFLWPRTQGIAGTSNSIEQLLPDTEFSRQITQLEPALELQAKINSDLIAIEQNSESLDKPDSFFVKELVPAVSPVADLVSNISTKGKVPPQVIDSEEAEVEEAEVSDWVVTEFSAGESADLVLQEYELSSANARVAASAELAVANPGLTTLQNTSLAQARIMASIDWLNSADRNSYTVQFMSGPTSNIEFAESFLRVLDKAELIEDTFMCMSTISGISYWTIKYGNFPGLSIGQKFINELPEQLHNYKPYVQNMSSVECNTNTTIASLISE